MKPWTNIALVGATLVLLGSGCGPTFGPRAEHGIVFYCPGAGNIDFGDEGVRKGLRAAGYEGQVATFVWTISFNPALDQTLRANARLRAGVLARHIEKYIDEYPGRPVNLIGLSAGSGVALWAVEGLADGYAVDNVVLLASSLHHEYDVGKALRRIRGRIYNYYSSEDPILAGPLKVFGTIDGKYFQEGAGAVGLHSPTGAGRIVNIRWREEFKQYGYYGGHTDVTNPRFVAKEIAQHISSNPATLTSRREPATALARPERDGHRD